MITNIHESWKPLFFNVIPQSFFREIDNMDEGVYFPVKEDIFRVFEMSVYDVKVVLLGQDPYTRENQATGLSFSVPKTMSKPPSLRNIEKELGKEIDRTFIPWRDQGVFLLNTALTVLRRDAGSHLELWKDFTAKVITFISEHNPCIWMLWGKHAESYLGYVVNYIYEYPENESELGKNVILVAPHPAAESYRPGAGFYGCDHFNKANNALKLNNKEPINW